MTRRELSALEVDGCVEDKEGLFGLKIKLGSLLDVKASVDDPVVEIPNDSFKSGRV